MNRENAKDYLPLVQALADGKQLEVDLYGDGKWIPVPSPEFFYAPHLYRIKPEPMVVWVNVYPDSKMFFSAYASKAFAEEERGVPSFRTVRFVEADES